MAESTCAIEDCDRCAVSRGWCDRHYRRWLYHGDPLALPRFDYEAKFWARVDVGHPLGCWLWTATRSGDGYGVATVASYVTSPAHRYAYEQLVGPIPDGLELDHLCRNPPCVNPDHLEPVTRRENALRGYGQGAKHARKTHCIHGHAFTSGNTYQRSDGGRRCRECKRRSSRERLLRNKARRERTA